MAFLLFIVILGSWIWSIVRGIQVSIYCAILNFLFPPISQIIFAIYEKNMRMPLMLMIGGFILIFLTSGEVVVDVN
ncbi:hypothetical protein [Aliikangiella sp. IMCC44359]|uniref:hypothetical protein n=1 Tax=Aliikangiella sp. IMCC44359 TaxID=3459125 RepID=UPI00403AF57E